ncbi:MAG TPA: BTAD domain-containing putative transcriptional regulator, partial [Acidimicrobiales bacterium]|nr:BTAD domain-containing putative transcriptional regulator [Acidimicrobiales bacterium]
MATEFGILGTLTVISDSTPLEVRGPRQRALLALLVLQANRVVTPDRIFELLWQGNPPRTAANTLQTHIVRLRRVLRAPQPDGGEYCPLKTISAGYLLEVDAEALDSARFEYLLSEARRAVTLERHAVAREVLRQALGIWRGPALIEFAAEPFAQVDATRLDELRIDALQEFAAASLACGRIAETIATLQPLVSAHPLREQPVGDLMVALYRAGRQGDALAAYRTLRLALREELGLDPSPELQRLEQLILEHAANLEPVALGATRRTHALPMQASVAAPRFVGRTEELTWLSGQWHAACRGEPRLAIVQGEPGIGKTRIAAEFAERCHRGGGTVLWGCCTEDASAPFEALASALAPLVETVPTATPLWHLFGVANDRALHNDPDIERQRMFQLVTELLERAASDVPVLLVLDDMQWVDRSTLALLAHFLRTTPQVCVLVLATVRTTEPSTAAMFHTTLGELISDERASLCDLVGLGPADIASLVADLLPGKGSVETGSVLQARTGGNPFFVAALLRQLDETCEGDLERLNELDLPDTVRGVIDRRIAHLDPTARELLEVAAVVGFEFDPRLVEEVGRLPPSLFARVLDEIDSAGIAVPVGATEYSFAHALIRDVIYQGVGRARRSLIHWQVAVAFERDPEYSRPERAAQLARHFAASFSREAAEKTLLYSRRAGEHSLSSLAYEDAYLHFDMALELIDSGQVNVEDATRADVQFARARASFASGERVHAKADFEEVAKVYQHLGDAERLTALALAISGTSMRHMWTEYGTVSDWLIELVREALASQGERTPGRVRLLARLAEELYFSPDAELRTAIAEEAVTMARRIGDDHALADALNGRLRALWHPANAHERLRASLELRELAAHTGDVELAMAGQGWSIVSQLELGLTAQLDDDVTRYAEMTDGHRSPHHRIWALAILGGRALARGAFDETERLIGEGMNLAPEVFGYAIQGFAGQLCTLRIEQGRAAEVLDAGRNFVTQYPQVPAWRAGLSVILAELELRAEAHEQLAILGANGLDAHRHDQEWLF